MAVCWGWGVPGEIRSYEPSSLTFRTHNAQQVGGPQTHIPSLSTFHTLGDLFVASCRTPAIPQSSDFCYFIEKGRDSSKATQHTRGLRYLLWVWAPVGGWPETGWTHPGKPWAPGAPTCILLARSSSVSVRRWRGKHLKVLLRECEAHKPVLHRAA